MTEFNLNQQKAQGSGVCQPLSRRESRRRHSDAAYRWMTDEEQEQICDAVRGVLPQAAAPAWERALGVALNLSGIVTNCPNGFARRLAQVLQTRLLCSFFDARRQDRHADILPDAVAEPLPDEETIALLEKLRKAVPVANEADRWNGVPDAVAALEVVITRCPDPACRALAAAIALELRLIGWE